MERKILVLEDEKDIGQFYVKHLKNNGYEPLLATDGFEGLNLLKTFAPQLILLDLGMPKMNGLEFYQYICDSKKMPRYPVLVLTGRGNLESVFKDFHIEGFLIKPFSREQLLKEVEIIFNKSDKKKEDDGAKRIVIVDENETSAQRISEVLSMAGYKSEIATSGTSGVEKITDDPPDMAVVNLNLADITGDLVILRLHGMAKTKRVKYVLYIEKKQTLDKIVMENLSHKSGIKIMCEYVNPAEILEAVTKVFQESPVD